GGDADELLRLLAGALQGSQCGRRQDRLLRQPRREEALHAARRPGDLGRVVLAQPRRGAAVHQVVRHARGAEAVVGAGRLFLPQGRPERPGLPQERPLRAGFPHFDGNREGLLGRAFLRAALARHAEARPRLRGRRQGHRAGSARRAGLRLGEGVQGRRKDVSSSPRDGDRAASSGPGRDASRSPSEQRMSEQGLSIMEHVARATPETVARRVRGLSDRAIQWLFISPTILLLLAINIFPLVWTIRLSFTNYRANRPNARLLEIGTANYVSVLTDPDVWPAMQSTAHFVFWTILLQTSIAFGLAWLVHPGFRGHGFWTITLPMALPFIMLAVLFRGIENFKMFDMVNLLTNGGPGSTTELASITLKREAFEKWRTGYSSAFAIILFVTVFGLANIYVKVLNRVKNR